MRPRAIQPIRSAFGARTAAVAVAAAVALSAAGASPAHAAAPGVVPDLTWGISDAKMERTAQLLADARPKWVRLDVRWHAIEPYGPGELSPLEIGRVDRAVAMARAAGAKIDLLLYGAPSWASGETSGPYYKNSPPLDVAEYARILKLLVERYRGQVDAYEIWNEPNTQRFWPTTGPDAAAYTELLKAAYAAVKQADPAATVVFGGLSGYHYDFLDAAYAAGARDHFDALGVHPYTDCGIGPDIVYRDGSGRIEGWSFVGYRELRRDMVARGDAKPIWATELGWSTSEEEDCSNGGWSTGVSEETQARYLTRAFEILEQDPYVPVAFAYSFRDYEVEGDPDTIETRFGLLRTDFSPRPAYHAFKRYAAGAAAATGAPATGPSGTARPGPTGSSGSAPRTGTRRAAVVLRVARRGGRVRLVGRVRGARGGRVVVVVRSRAGRRTRRGARLDRRGRFRVALRLRPGRAFAARAHFRGHRHARATRSRLVRFRS